MSGETPPDPFDEGAIGDDVVGKIDQLLNRHRPKPAPEDTIPVLVQASQDEAAPDGIPVLTDVVEHRSQLLAMATPDVPRPIDNLVILRRLATALEGEHLRLREQIGDDPAQIRMLDSLAAELRRALPAAVRAALSEKGTEPAKPE
ncbi:MAG TPA: hypothetical protein VHB46_14925 [Burkholderiales bacterium]|nr:hypothetical protein [Burkholderiales bacterium]